MPRISAAAVVQAIRALADCNFSTKEESALEAFLVAKRLQARRLPITIDSTNQVVEEIFSVLPDEKDGRIQPFVSFDAGKKWGTRTDSGRKTVWNVTTRGGSSARKLFQEEDIRKGLKPSAAGDLHRLFTERNTPLPPRNALAVYLLRDYNLSSGVSESELATWLDLEFNLSATELDQITGAGIELPPLWEGEEWVPDRLPHNLRPRLESLPQTSVPTARGVHRLVIDGRIRRMVERAIISSRAVILVGPPGTGKTTLLNEIARDICKNPRGYGLDWDPLSEPTWVTAEEGWTTRELVGGETVVGGEVRFRPGYVLRSIQENRWLAIDELNRADMDKIFGPLFTWLSGDEANTLVGLGPVAPNVGAAEVMLGWAEGGFSTIEGDEAFEDPLVADQISFMAGRSWRLLGTYNAMDAQRVFRVGHALGRRFTRVPVPPISAAEFKLAVDGKLHEIHAEAKERLQALYESHLQVPPAVLGPALFLRMGEYLRTCTDPQGAHSLDEEIAEAYLINAGAWLARLEDEDLHRLQKLVISSGAITPEQWEWLKKLLPNLG